MVFVLSNRDLYQFCPWSHIHCVQLIAYLDHVLSIVLIPPFLNIDDEGQITLQCLKWLSGKLSLHYGITRHVVRDQVRHWNLQCISNEDTTVSHGVMQWKGVSKCKIFVESFSVVVLDAIEKKIVPPISGTGDTTALYRAIQCKLVSIWFHISTNVFFMLHRQAIAHKGHMKTTNGIHFKYIFWAQNPNLEHRYVLLLDGK